MVRPRSGSKQLLRDLNKHIVLSLIMQEKNITRNDVAKRSMLPPATITHIITEFVAAGLVLETTMEGHAGRPPLTLQINPQAGYVVGVKLSLHCVSVVFCNLLGDSLHFYEQELTTNLDPFQIVKTVANAIKQCIQEARIPLKRVLGVGLGMDGLIDSAHGICLYSSIFQWHNVEIGPALEFELHMPVRIDNNVNTLAVAERQLGQVRNLTNFLLVLVGSGVGLSIVIGGNIYRGARGGSGELGHTLVDTSEQAPLCHCGKTGCLEAVVSDYGLVQAAGGSKVGQSVEEALEQLMARALAHDNEALRIFQHAGTLLGSTLANLINLFDPEDIFLVGSPAKQLMLESMRHTIANAPFMDLGREASIHIGPAIDPLQWARSAASLIIQEMFLPPLYDQQETIAIDDVLAQSRQQFSRKR